MTAEDESTKMSRAALRAAAAAVKSLHEDNAGNLGGLMTAAAAMLFDVATVIEPSDRTEFKADVLRSVDIAIERGFVARDERVSVIILKIENWGKGGSA